MTYEITYILKPELTVEEQQAAAERVATHIGTLGGEMQSVERTFSVERGGTDENNLRKFAYPIKHYRQGYYYTMIFDLPNEAVTELDQLLSREGDILRFLVVKDFTPLTPIEELPKKEEPVEQPQSRRPQSRSHKPARSASRTK